MTDDQHPTELARPIDATEASLAWAIDDSPEVVTYRPPWIARTAVAGALVLIAGAGGVAVLTLRDVDAAPAVAAPTSSSVSTIPPPSPAKTPARTTSQQPEPVGTIAPPAPVAAAPILEPAAVGAPPLGGVTVEQVAAYDRQFIRNLRARNWAVWDEESMYLNAHKVCAFLQQGYTPRDVGESIAAGSGLPPGQAASFVTIAMLTYPDCP